MRAVGFPGGASGKEPTCQCRRHKGMGWIPADPLEEEMATHSSTLARRIPWREEPGGLQCMGPQRGIHGEQPSIPKACMRSSASIRYMHTYRLGPTARAE